LVPFDDDLLTWKVVDDWRLGTAERSRDVDRYIKRELVRRVYGPPLKVLQPPLLVGQRASASRPEPPLNVTVGEPQIEKGVGQHRSTRVSGAARHANKGALADHIGRSC
jgi:hypothetical protein